MSTHPRVPTSPNRHAVLIGVCHYPDLVDSDAIGADWDAYAWVAMAETLGCPVENVRLLVSSPPGTHRKGAGGIDPARESADRSSILEAIRGLVATLRATPDAHGLLLFAGHGTDDEGGFALCPADTARVGGTLTNTISAATLLALLGDGLPNLTVVLDACFSGAVGQVDWDGAPAAVTRFLAGSASGASVADTHTALGSKAVLLTACGPEEQAYAYSLRPNILAERIPHGVLTAAVSALMQRWTPPGSTDPVPYPISYGTLTRRAGEFAAALQFPQHPQVYPPSAAKLHAFENDRGDTLRDAPNVPGWEISGGNNDTVIGLYQDGSGTPKGMVLYASVYPGFFWNALQPGGDGSIVALGSTNLATSFNPSTGPKGVTQVFNDTYCFQTGRPSTSNASPCTIVGIWTGKVQIGFLVLAGGAWYWFLTAPTLPTGSSGFVLGMPDMGRALTINLLYPLVFRNVPGAWSQVSGSLPAPNGARYFIYLTGGTCVGCVDFTNSFATTWYYWGGSVPTASAPPFAVSESNNLSLLQPSTSPTPPAGATLYTSSDTN